MAILVVEFSRKEYKIRKAKKNQLYLNEIAKFGGLELWRAVETSQNFQSQFSISKIIRIFMIFLFIEKYEFKSTFFVIDIF